MSQILVEVRAKWLKNYGRAELKLSSTYDCMKFPQIRDNTKVINMNMFIMNQNIFKMVQIK